MLSVIKRDVIKRLSSMEAKQDQTMELLLNMQEVIKAMASGQPGVTFNVGAGDSRIRDFEVCRVL